MFRMYGLRLFRVLREFTCASIRSMTKPTFISEKWNAYINSLNFNDFGIVKQTVLNELLSSILMYQNNEILESVQYGDEMRNMMQFLSAEERINVSICCKTLFTQMFPFDDIIRKRMNTLCWKLIDSSLNQIFDDNKNADELYSIFRGINSFTNDKHKTLSVLLVKRYLKHLKPILFLQHFIFQISTVESFSFCLTTREKRCSWGEDCYGKIAILCKTKKNTDSYTSRFIFCRYHLDVMKVNYNLFN